MVKAVQRVTEHLRLEKAIGMALLSDFYGALLTEKQRQALRLFYEEDYSLSEIAAECSCSRQAAQDIIKRSEALLLEYEQKLGLVAKHRERQSLLRQAESELAVLGFDRERHNEGAFWHIWQRIIEE